MNTIPPADINWFAERFSALSNEMLENWRDAGEPTIGDEPSPDLLTSAMSQLLELLQLIDRGTPYPHPDSAFQEDPDITELGGYGLSILEEFVTLAEAFNMPDQISHWEQLAIAFSRWVIQHDGEVAILSAVVNGLARIANQSSEQNLLERLHGVINEITNAVPLSLIEGGENDENLEPWRILLFNRAIIATRIFSPRLMDEAFTTLTEYFPNEAPDFFREGIEQLDIQGYPTEVREVMERYYRDWPVKRTLH
ncbi:MAG: hypothetical protein MI754_16725 [Chromatiales bacterium]|nr:hypothetical protein [Chromatiales bacterium]